MKHKQIRLFSSCSAPSGWLQSLSLTYSFLILVTLFLFRMLREIKTKFLKCALLSEFSHEIIMQRPELSWLCWDSAPELRLRLKEQQTEMSHVLRVHANVFPWHLDPTEEDTAVLLVKERDIMRIYKWGEHWVMPNLVSKTTHTKGHKSMPSRI